MTPWEPVLYIENDICSKNQINLDKNLKNDYVNYVEQHKMEGRLLETFRNVAVQEACF